MQASLVAPMTTKETSKKVPSYFYDMQLLLGPNRNTVSALSTAACTFSTCRLGTRPRCPAAKWQQGQQWMLEKYEHPVSCRRQKCSPAEMATLHLSCLVRVLSWKIAISLLPLPYLSCLLQNLGECLVPGSIRRWPFLYFFLPLFHPLALSTFFPLPNATQQIFAVAAVIALGLCAVAFVVSEPAPQEDSISNVFSGYVSVI